MFGSDDLNNGDNGSQLIPSWLLMALCSLPVLAYTLLRYAEHKNNIDFDSRGARVVAGFIKIYMLLLHAQETSLNIPQEGPGIYAFGPHRTGVEALAASVSLEGPPPRFLATTDYNHVKAVKWLLEFFLTIPVQSNVRNTQAQQAALDVLDPNGNGRVALFPQGKICLPGDGASMIYPGAAEWAYEKKVPIYVIRTDGAWSISNQWLPRIIRDNIYYRVLGSLFVPNKFKPTLCCRIDIHLKAENRDRPKEEVVTEMNAILYAYFRRLGDLTEKDIKAIESEIESGAHLTIWKARLRQHQIERELRDVKEEHKRLEADSSSAFGV